MTNEPNPKADPNYRSWIMDHRIRKESTCVAKMDRYPIEQMDKASDLVHCISASNNLS